MNLFELGNFTLASGATSKWKIECEALLSKDWLALAEMVRQMVGPFSEVHGVPRGGLPLAEALRPFVGLSGPVLVVDDVLTTGGSINRVMGEWSGKDVVGAVVFARGQCPYGVSALFQMPEAFWLKPRHR